MGTGRALACYLLLLAGLSGQGLATEMEFELKDNEVQCFYEELEKDQRFFLEFQVKMCA